VLRTRIAPTPSGLLHAGNAVNFLLTEHLARTTGRELMLRIDDLDEERVRPAYVQDIFEQLERLGTHWDLGPRTADELETTWSQRHRLPLYHDLLEELRTAGQLFACNCTRTTIARCRCAELGTDLDSPDVTWRLRLRAPCVVTFRTTHGPVSTDLSERMPPPVLRSREGRPAYQVASLADDLHFGIDLVVRGEDLYASTACQVYMARLLGRSSFADALFVHHRLLLDANGTKLSKSAGAAALDRGPEGRTDVHALRELALQLAREMA
jgi:glutamyl/glutaminyl-tRNA synthetase